LRIEDYALIGDCESAALVGRDGSIDWLCWPRFDSPACFAALLGGPEHGRWKIAPQKIVAVKRRYRPDTLILETDFEAEAGAVTLVDFMPVRGLHSDLVRMVVGRRGRVAMEMELILRFDYGASVPWVTRLADGTGIRAISGPDKVVLCGPVALDNRDLKTLARFSVEAGETVPLTLAHSPSHVEAPHAPDAHAALAETERFWRDWAGRCTKIAGPWASEVRRSLITLKALTYAPTGGIVAAPTTSLPEKIGGVRNWDYRYCWLRDATLTLLAFMDAGFHDEALAWREWLVRAVAGSPEQMRIMYGVAGERRIPEWEIDWLPGYEGSAPVRLGNAAAAQLQLDVYGELIDALYQGCKAGLSRHDVAWDLQRALLGHLEKVWIQPDEGIWEVRGPPRHFTYSKVMAWVAFDRAVKMVEGMGMTGPVERWRELRARIHRDVCERGYSARRGAFVQSYGAEELDAALLLIPITGFLPARDPRVLGTVEAIQRELTVDGLVQRYLTHQAVDGLPAGEGVFLACSFWLADNLCMQGRGAEARELFARLLGLCNDVGLLAEEYDPVARRFLGNSPQASSHVALVNTAFNLGEATKPVEQRAEQISA
jgi:GH15 family glucan-1,4-alpha-glucosidase